MSWERAMRLISVYCLVLAMTSLVALPPAAQIARSPDRAAAQVRVCLSGIDRIDMLLDGVLDESGAALAVRDLEVARSMMGESDYKGCATYLDNAMRTLKASRPAR